MHPIIYLSSFWFLVASFCIAPLTRDIEPSADTSTTNNHFVQWARTWSIGPPTQTNPNHETETEKLAKTTEERPSRQDVWMGLEVRQHGVTPSCTRVPFKASVTNPLESRAAIRNAQSFMTPNPKHIIDQPRIPQDQSSRFASAQRTIFSKAKRKDGSSFQNSEVKKMKPTMTHTSTEQTQQNRRKELTLMSENHIQSPSRVIGISPPDTMPNTNALALTELKFQEKPKIALSLQEVNSLKKRRKYLEISHKLDDYESFKDSLIYTYLEVLGARIFNQFGIACDPKRSYNSVHLKQLKDAVVSHSIKAVVSYIYSMNHVSTLPLYQDHNELKIVLEEAVLNLESFWKRQETIYGQERPGNNLLKSENNIHQAENNMHEAGNSIHEDKKQDTKLGIKEDKTVPFILSTDEEEYFASLISMKYTFNRSKSNQIGTFLFLLWLKAKHQGILQNISTQSKRPKFQHALLTFFHEYIMTSMGRQDLNEKILELSEVDCIADNLQFLDKAPFFFNAWIKTPFTINWAKSP